MLQTEDILEVMGGRALSVCKVVFPQTRPNAVTESLTEFIVVSLPYSVVNKMLGEDDDWWLDQTVSFEIYVADKRSASNPKRFDLATMRRLREGVMNLFPIIDAKHGFKITRPRLVVPASSDGNGYHYSRIQAKMSTML